MEQNKLQNDHPEFVGVPALKKRHGDQVDQFEKWSANQWWKSFHESHYDWWAFPIDQPSRLGYAYTVYAKEVDLLKKDSSFTKKYLRGVELLLLSWGWDLYSEKLIDHPAPDQCWHNWPIRLFKCMQSLALFGFKKELRSVLRYGRFLIERGEDFTFRGKNLAGPFLDYNKDSIC